MMNLGMLEALSGIGLVVGAIVAVVFGIKFVVDMIINRMNTRDILIDLGFGTFGVLLAMGHLSLCNIIPSTWMSSIVIAIQCFIYGFLTIITIVAAIDIVRDIQRNLRLKKR